MKRKCMLVCLIVCFFCHSLFADDDFLRGLDAYSRYDWEQAIISFESALVSKPAEHKEILYWLVMAQSSAQHYQLALNYADTFLRSYNSDERAAEVQYQQGRLLYLCGQYKQSLEVLQGFIQTYPNHQKIPSAQYWLGEIAYETGAYANAREIFVTVVVKYPESDKVSAARQKIILIDQKQAETRIAENAVPLPEHTEASGLHSLAQDQEPAVAQSEQTDAQVLQEEAESSTADVLHDNSRIEAVERQLDDERKKNDELYQRITALEERINALSTSLAAAEAENQARMTQEQQEREIKERELKQQEIEKRKKELRELRQRVRTLEKMYEQRTTGER